MWQLLNLSCCRLSTITDNIFQHIKMDHDRHLMAFRWWVAGSLDCMLATTVTKIARICAFSPFKCGEKTDFLLSLIHHWILTQNIIVHPEFEYIFVFNYKSKTPGCLEQININVKTNRVPLKIENNVETTDLIQAWRPDPVTKTFTINSVRPPTSQARELGRQGYRSYPYAFIAFYWSFIHRLIEFDSPLACARPKHTKWIVYW